MNTTLNKMLDESDIRHIMSNGTDFLGAEIIQKFFGFQPVKDSEMYFSVEELKKLKEKHSLFTPARLSVKTIYDRSQNKTLDGKNFLADISRYKNESFYVSEIPALGTRIISRELIEGSIGKNMLDCQQVLIEHTKQHLPLASCSDMFNKNLNLAEQELNDQNSEIKLLMEKDSPEATEKIANLAVCKMFTSQFSTIAQFALVDNCVNKRKLLSNVYSWSKSLTDDGRSFASFGRFGDGGASGVRGLPRREWHERGILFSCSVETLFA